MERTLCTLLAAAALMACGPSHKEAGGGVPPLCNGGLCLAYDAGFTASTSSPNTLGVTFSGETLGIAGLPFAPANPGEPYFVDGWSVIFSEYIFVLDDIRLNEAPLQSSTVWQQMGPQVATRKGPWVMDAHRAAGFVGKDGVEPASGLFLWTELDNGQPFDTGTRYAFSFNGVPASYPAFNVNLTADELGDYDLMVKKGWSKLVKGTALYVGTGVYPDAGVQAKFSALPTTVNFAFGWDDATQVLNCVNYDFSNSEDNLADRGVQTSPDDTYIAQITMHTDHVFWDKLRQEGTNLRFDPIAAYAPANTTLAEPFWINNSPQKLLATFSDGTPLPDGAPFQPNPSPNAVPFTSDGTGNGLQLFLNINGTNNISSSLPVFMAFSAQSQAHLNAQGLCYILGQHASDPYFSPQVKPAP